MLSSTSQKLLTEINKRVSERLVQFNSLFQTADSDVHIVHTTHVITTYTLVPLSTLAYITQYTCNNYLKKKEIKKKQKREGFSSEIAILHQF